MCPKMLHSGTIALSFSKIHENRITNDFVVSFISYKVLYIGSTEISRPVRPCFLLPLPSSWWTAMVSYFI
jgi:hypothetical protein